MRISELLVSGALLFGCSSVHAAVVDGVRQKPVPQATEFQYGEVYYLYNTGAKGFWCGANDYGTRASVADEGWKVKLDRFVTSEGYNAVILRDSVETGSFKGWRKGWFTTAIDATSGSSYLDGGVYTDFNNQTDTLWNIVQMDDAVIRLRASYDNPNYVLDSVKAKVGEHPAYVGVDKTLDNGTNTRLWAFLDAENPSHCTEWNPVTPADYKVYIEALAVYNVAQELYALLTEAKGKSVDVSEWTKVYENEASTIEELKAAIAAVKTAIQKADETNVDVNSPIDKTNLITNPDYASAANTGWSGTAPAFGYGAAEFYNKNYNAYQKIGEASNGVYALSLNAFYRAGSAVASYENYTNGDINKLAQLYAVAGEDTLTTSIMNIFKDARDSKLGTGTELNEKGQNSEEGTAFVPNNMQAASAYFEDGRYVNNIVFFGVDDNQFTIGLSKSSTLSTDWTLFDNWKLTYYGNSAAAFQKWQEQVVADAFDATTIPEGTAMTNGTVDAYNAVKNGLSTPSTKAEVMANIKALNEATAAIKANIAAWEAYKAAVVAAQATIDDDDVAEGELKTILDDLVYESDDDFEDLTLTTEEVIAKTEKLVAANDNCIKNSIKVGADVTDKFLVNARYEEGATGWNGSPTVNGPKDNKCAEKYNTAFDVYQEVKDAPVGVYSISLQGFYRPGDNSVAWPIYKANDFKWEKSTSICVYVNNNSNPLKNIYDEMIKKGELFQTTDLVGPAPFEAEKDDVTQDSVWFVNDMTNAGIAFSNGMYTSTAFGLVAKAGDALRIGIKGELDNTNQWICWDNFKMVYQGFKAEIIKPELEKAITSAQAFVNGSAPVSPMSKTAFDKLTKAISEGNASVEGEDGKAMFTALSDLYEAIEAANASIKACEELVSLAESMNNIAMSGDCQASSTDISKAIALYTEVIEGVEGTSLTDEQIADYTTKINEMLVTLKIPAGEATDDNPQDLTSLIATPGFEDAEGNNSTAGWTGATGSFGNNDTQKAALLYEYYEKTDVDMYQDIVGLPNGTYQVSASAFCRMGGSAADAEAYTANPDTLSNALLYAVSADNVMNAVGIMPISAGALEESIGSGSESDVTINGTAMKVPNDMVSANAYFQIGQYVNTVTVKVTEKTLRIGLRKDTKVGSDWLIIDNFKLIYFGENSDKQPSGDPTGIDTVDGNTAKVAKVEYYGVNGVRNATLVKGINIMKTTMADGKVVVNKVVVK